MMRPIARRATPQERGAQHRRARPTGDPRCTSPASIRVRFAHLPTPLEPLPRLTAASRRARSLWIKRDDCTGLAGGGNKTRKLEYLLGDALANDADTLVTQGAVQSNHVRQTAAAAAKFGLACDDPARGAHRLQRRRLHPVRQRPAGRAAGRQDPPRAAAGPT